MKTLAGRRWTTLLCREHADCVVREEYHVGTNGVDAILVTLVGVEVITVETERVSAGVMLIPWSLVGAVLGDVDVMLADARSDGEPS